MLISCRSEGVNDYHPECIHRQISIAVAAGMMSIWCHGISSHDDMDMSVHIRCALFILKTMAFKRTRHTPWLQQKHLSHLQESGRQCNAYNASGRKILSGIYRHHGVAWRLTVKKIAAPMMTQLIDAYMRHPLYQLWIFEPLHSLHFTVIFTVLLALIQIHHLIMRFPSQGINYPDIVLGRFLWNILTFAS